MVLTYLHLLDPKELPLTIITIQPKQWLILYMRCAHSQAAPRGTFLPATAGRWHLPDVVHRKIEYSKNPVVSQHQWQQMGLSENSVPLNPMVLLIIIPIKWLFHWEYTLFSDKPKCWTGWWFQPEKWWSSSVGMMKFPTEWKNNPNVPNHQPVEYWKEYVNNRIPP